MDLIILHQFITFLSILYSIQRTDSHVLSHEDARSVNDLPAPESFVDSLFETYGKNKSVMTQAEFSSLLKVLKVGSISRETTSSAELAEENGVKNGYPKVGLPLKQPGILLNY